MTQSQYIKDLSEFVAIPSISTDPKHKPEMAKALNWLKKKAKQIGLENIQSLKTAGCPIFYAQYLKAGKNKPTILIYGHYDVQPPEPLEEWDTQPFKLDTKGDYAYGRGVSDNKGPIVTMLAALKQVIKDPKSSQYNFKIFIEGEEELGSPNVKKAIKDNLKLLKSDLAIIFDETMPHATGPCLYTSLRGLTYFEVCLKAHPNDLHSGVYGGKAIDPILELSKILAQAIDSDNKITIPEFYRDVLHQKYLGVIEEGSWICESGYTSEESCTVRPSYSINGIWGGYTDPGKTKTVIPKSAFAKLSFRLVANQDPAHIKQRVIEWFKNQEPAGTTLTIEELGESAVAVFTQTDNPYIEAIASVLEKTFESKPKLLKSGGTIGAAGEIQASYGVPLLMFGFPLDDCNMHAPNEKIHIPTMLKGTQALIEFFQTPTKA